MTSEVVKQLVNEEIQQLIKISVNYKTAIDTAKTQYKKQFFIRKLKQNNELVLKYLTAAQNLQIDQAVRDEIDGTITESTE
jgi:hypothetical protein